ncbi:efflux RND transporter permease subunit, partial [Pseudomonas aeruginosa]
MSEFFIKRPNFAWVVALFISLAGLLVISKLPVAQYTNLSTAPITL